MRTIARNNGLGLLIGMLLIALSVSAVQAAPALKVATRLTIDAIPPMTVGKDFEVTAHLTDSVGKKVGAVSNEVLLLFIDDVQVRRIRTDHDGTGIFPVPGNLSVGVHKIKVEYPGSTDLMPTTATTDLKIAPAVVEVHTVPPLANVTFALAGRNFSSDKAGIARIDVDKPGTYKLEILNTHGINPDTKAEFSRWDDEVFSPSREVIVPMDEPIEAGFEVSHMVGETFVDLGNQPVNPERITSLTIKGSNGVVIKLEDGKPRWLTSGRVVRRDFGLEETKILYSIMDVAIDGTNVISQAQQRFFVKPNDLWKIQLLLYSADFTARDALFRFPIGKGVRLEYPDGHTQDFSFTPANSLKVDSLARGLYRVTVIGASGMAPPTPLAMSRDQTVELIVLSRIDMAFGLALGAFIALALLFFGRPHLLQLLISIPRLVVEKRHAWKEAVVVLVKQRKLSERQQCPVCRATTKQFKAGLNRSGSQRYRCRVCGKVYTPTPKTIRYSPEIQGQALHMYLEGNSRRSIAESLKVHPRTVSKWIARHTLPLPAFNAHAPKDALSAEEGSASLPQEAQD